MHTAGPAADLTIEELAAKSGMTVRNIRAHRARGLLPAPEVRERVGYYGPEHLSRLQLITQMQADGFNLRAIGRLLEHTHGAPAELLMLRQALNIPFETEEPRIFTLAELQERFGEQADRKTLSRAVRMGALTVLADDRYEAPMPSLIDAAADVVALGVPFSHALVVGAKVRDHCQSVAREFVRLFLEDVWKPFADAGYPPERWSEVTGAIDSLRPLSSRVLVAAFQLTMSRQVDAAFGRELERVAKRHR